MLPAVSYRVKHEHLAEEVHGLMGSVLREGVEGGHSGRLVLLLLHVLHSSLRRRAHVWLLWGTQQVGYQIQLEDERERERVWELSHPKAFN